MAADMKVIAVTRSETRKGDPMWTLQTAGGDRINVFNNMLERPPWDNSGYRAWFEAMESGQTDRWMNSPILVGIAKPGKYLQVFSVQPRAPDAKPDKTPQPGDIWQLHGWHWWNTLKTSSRRAIRCSSPPAVIGDNGILMVGRITCAEARAAGIAPVQRGHPAYPRMDDRDNDGVVCE